VTDPLPRELPRDQLARAQRLLRRARRHLLAGLGGAVLGAALIAALVLARPARWVSQVVMAYEEGLQWDAEEGRERPRQVVQRLRETLLARTRLPQVVQELELSPRLVAAGRMDDAVEELLQGITFRVEDGGTFTISATGATPQEAQRLAARLSELVIADNARLRSAQVEVARRFLEEQARRNEEQLRAKETLLARFLARHPEFVPEGATGGSAARLAQRRRPAGLEPEPVVARPPPRRPASTPAPAAPAPPAALVAADRQAQEALAAARRDLDDLGKRYTAMHPAVVAAALRLQDAERDARVAGAALAAAESATPAAAPAAPPAPEPVVERARQPAPPAPPPESPEAVVGVETEYATLSREVAEARELVQKVDGRHFGAAMAQAAFASGNAAQVRVISPAYLPAHPAGASRRALALAGLLASLVLGAAACLLAALLDDRVLEPQDLEALGLAPLLGEVARLGTVAAAPAPARRLPPGGSARPVTTGGAPGGAGPAARDARLVLLHSPDSEPAAGFRILRHRLASQRGVATLLVTSAGPEEGKTTCAVNLALAFSEAGRARVLLLDANFRRPMLGRLLGDGAPAAADGAPSHPWTAIRPVTPWLDVAQARRDLPPPFVEGPAMRAFLAEMGAGAYDVIIVDGPPVLGSADVNALEEGVSAVLLTAWAGRSRATRLRAAAGQLGAEKLVGLVLLTPTPG
jgi:hypothetical protein